MPVGCRQHECAPALLDDRIGAVIDHRVDLRGRRGHCKRRQEVSRFQRLETNRAGAYPTPLLRMPTRLADPSRMSHDDSPRRHSDTMGKPDRDLARERHPRGRLPSKGFVCLPWGCVPRGGSKNRSTPNANSHEDSSSVQRCHTTSTPAISAAGLRTGTPECFFLALLRGSSDTSRQGCSRR